MIKRFLKKIEEIYKYRYFSKNENGAYKFLLQKVYKSTDIDFLENIWQLDYFREVLIPQEMDLTKIKRVLVLAPHQDDEIIGCGGTLLKLVNLGCEVTVGFLTNGAELSNPENSIEIRRQEAKLVCEELGCKMIELGVDNITMDINKNHIDTLENWIHQDWDAIFSVWPIDQPPKHRLCAYLLGKVIASSNYQGTILYYAVHTDLLPNFYVDITKEIDKKQLLLSHYTSQLEAQRLDHLSKGLDAWRSRFLPVSNKARSIETFMRIPSEACSDFQKVFNASDKRKLFKANDVCIRSFKNLQKL